MEKIKKIAANVFAFVVMLNVISMIIVVLTMGFLPYVLTVILAYIITGVIHAKWTRRKIKKVFS